MNEDSNPPLRGVTPHLTVRGAKQAIEFYGRAFGATVVRRVDADDGQRLLHCHLRINDDDILMADEFEEHGAGLGSGPSGVTLHLTVDDADAWWDRAVTAGAQVSMPLADQFWGDRYGQLQDPFGHRWSIAASVKE